MGPTVRTCGLDWRKLPAEASAAQVAIKRVYEEMEQQVVKVRRPVIAVLRAHPQRCPCALQTLRARAAPPVFMRSPPFRNVRGRARPPAFTVLRSPFKHYAG